MAGEGFWSSAPTAASSGHLSWLASSSGPVDEAPPAVHRRVQPVAGAREQQRVTASHAEADAPDLAADLLPRSQKVRRALEVAQRGGVGHREKPPHDRLHIVHRRRPAFARVQVHPQRHVAEVGEAVDHILGVLGQPGRRVNHDHRRPGPLVVARGRGQIAVHRRALRAGEGELLGTYARGIGDGAGDPFRAGLHLHCRAHRSLLSVAYRIAFGYARVAATSMSAKKPLTTRKSSHTSPAPPTPTSIWRRPCTS